ncbi:MAG: phosphotransferase [Phycisphaeraceae bacterium]|nr:phosphotransferase [Phycisphaeraceae bacterium]
MNLSTAQMIAEQFAVAGEVTDVAPHQQGHINDSFAVTAVSDDGPARYFLQRINESIFTDIPGLMENVARTCDHLRRQLEQEGIDPTRRALRLVKTEDGDHWLRDKDGEPWRMYHFIEDTAGKDVAEDPADARRAARAFGNFLRRMADLPEPRLNETIPNFHHTPTYLDRLDEAVDADTEGRVADCKAEILWVAEHRHLVDRMTELKASGEIPERVTHNDTKLNNVLFDTETGEAI